MVYDINFQGAKVVAYLIWGSKLVASYHMVPPGLASPGVVSLLRPSSPLAPLDP